MVTQQIAYVTSDGANVMAPGMKGPIAIAEAEALGFDVQRVAWSFDMNGKQMVRYADRNCGSLANAEAAGFVIEPMPTSMRAALERERERDASTLKAERRARTETRSVKRAEQSDDAPHSPVPAYGKWGDKIVASEEARARPEATRALLEMHNASTITAARAVALLAALPIEQTHEQMQREKATRMSEQLATKLMVRAAEIRVAALGVRGAQGDQAAAKEAQRIGLALKHHADGSDIVSALRSAGANLDAIADMARRAA